MSAIFEQFLFGGGGGIGIIDGLWSSSPVVNIPKDSNWSLDSMGIPKHPDRIKREKKLKEEFKEAKRKAKQLIKDADVASWTWTSSIEHSPVLKYFETFFPLFTTNTKKLVERKKKEESKISKEKKKFEREQHGWQFITDIHPGRFLACALLKIHENSGVKPNVIIEDCRGTHYPSLYSNTLMKSIQKQKEIKNQNEMKRRRYEMIPKVRLSSSDKKKLKKAGKIHQKKREENEKKRKKKQKNRRNKKRRAITKIQARVRGNAVRKKTKKTKKSTAATTKKSTAATKKKKTSNSSEKRWRKYERMRREKQFDVSSGSGW